MSIWADINRRSQGLQKRKEDDVERYHIRMFAEVALKLTPPQKLAEIAIRIHKTDWGDKYIKVNETL